jgi:hypothetical protein
VVGQWFSAGGATITATIDESIDGTNADSSQSLGAAAAAGPASPTPVRPYAVDPAEAGGVGGQRHTILRGCLKAT